jgi:hypothetical protein
MPAGSATELEDKRVGELWRKYRPMEGKDRTADLALAPIRKMGPRTPVEYSLRVRGVREKVTRCGSSASRKENGTDSRN